MKGIALFLMMCLISFTVTAQTITQKNSNATQQPNTAPKNKYILDPNSPIPSLVQKNESPDQRVTRVYASHVLTALCAQDVMTRFRDTNWTPQQKSMFWKSYQGGCRCLSTEILSVVPPGEVVDFARYTFGGGSDASETVNTQRMDAIANIYGSPQLAKKCGLPK